MDFSDIARRARDFSAMVKIQGPDPKGLKMRRHAFHLHQSGVTTLSASGLLLPPGCLSETPPIINHIGDIHNHAGAFVITSASLVEPFLTAEHRENPTAQEFFPKLIPDARIDVLVEGVQARNSSDEPNMTPQWLPARLLALVDVSASSSALQSLIGTHSSSLVHGSWEVGWTLAPLNNDDLPREDAFQRQVDNDIRPSLKSYSDDSSNAAVVIKSAARIAFLAVQAVDLKGVLHIDISGPQKRGDILLVMGSPFGVLSQLHFLNSTSVGSVANCCPPESCHSSLLMADIRCLPGMEGAPVFDRYANLTGILTRPLRQKDGGAELQLVITWNAIATTWSNEPQKEVQEKELVERNIRSVNGLPSYCSDDSRRSIKCLTNSPDVPNLSQSSLDKAISSIALVAVGDGAWASGIVLNSHGLILTNAHILEPWRFGKTSLLGLMEKTTSEPVEHEESYSELEGNIGEGKRQIVPLSHSGGSNASESYRNEASFFNTKLKSYRKISVRLDHVDPKMWCDARVVYVSKGPLDVALLQLECVPGQLCSITSDFACPDAGVSVHVIGHGLLGPRSETSPSVSSGVLANIVRIPGPLHWHGSSMHGTQGKAIPVMLQTTAAVHPGASGGAVVNSHGHMIGLVTSNAKHGGGTTIPHMNFSIPCAALEPIFRFSEKQDISILKVLDRPNKLLSAVWALVPAPSQSTTSPLEKKNEEGKGSRFSKFLAERQAEFIPSEDIQRIVNKKFPNDILRPSKM